MSKNSNIISCDKISTMSPQKLAFIGDAVYELMVRCKIVESYEGNIGSLNSVKIKNVCCSAQSELYEKIKDDLSEKEIEIYKRGRNAVVSGFPKKISPCVYHRATGVEALFGYLYLVGKYARLEKFIEKLEL